jgi:hypothetical protein
MNANRIIPGLPNYPSELTLTDWVQRNRERQVAEEQRQREHARYQARYRDESFRQKVQRLAQKRWLEFDAIRREVEASFPQGNRPAAERRRFRECLARLVNHYRRDQRRGWLH